MKTQAPMQYMADRYHPVRRNTIPVRVGNKIIGGGAPVLVQSMTTTSPKEIAATVKQTLELASAGCELVRITAPTVKDAECLQEIMRLVRAAGCSVPVSADIHFQPRAAFESLKWVEKVRINPGNFVDSGIMTLKEISDEEFQAGRQKVFDSFGPFVREAKSRGVALRIGVNHGSLGARMLYRYGDTVEGMVESALEFLDVCEAENFDQLVFSLKSSNPRVAVQAYRLLAARLDSEGRKPYPFHVGVTEAGEGEDGRLKSAVGIGSLLLDGLGDTIRVSLTEHPVAEIPVARDLVRVCEVASSSSCFQVPDLPIDPFSYRRRVASEWVVGSMAIGGAQPVAVAVSGKAWSPALALRLGKDRSPECSVDQPVDGLPFLPVRAIVSPDELHALATQADSLPSLVCWSYTGSDRVSGYRALVSMLHFLGRTDPILLSADLPEDASGKMRVAAELGSLLGDGVGDAILLKGQDPSMALDYTYDLLQAAGLRRTKTEYVSCPGCGRTLFNLQDVLGVIKARTGHLKNVSIAVMGCIVNGPGEMADADFGYVGGAPGHISLYEGKALVKKNIPEAEALDALVDLIRTRGKWIDP